jgi:AcrR family transcriptional regulator
MKRASKRGAETRARILKAARELLAKTGPESLTLRGVAARAEVSLGNLQFHYADLDALLAGLLEQELGDTEDIIRTQAGHGEVARAGVDVLLAQHADVASTRLLFSLWALALGRPAVRRLLRKFYAGFRARVAAHLTGCDVDERAWLIVALLEGSAVLRNLEPNTRSPHDAALRALLLSLAGGR